MSRLLEETKKTLKENNLVPKKSLGQNFLIDEVYLKKIIEASRIKNDEILVEIGAGLGTLTKELAKRAKRVIAIEKDEKLINVLKKILQKEKINNIELIQGDILKIKLPILDTQQYKVIGNLPFYITAPIIRLFLEHENPPKEMILTVQKEVAQKISQHPPKMNLLAVSVQIYAKPKIIDYIPKNSFFPKPKIDSAIIKITPLNWQKIFIEPPSEFKSKEQIDILRALFFKIVKIGFSHPRKTIINNLTMGLNSDKKEIEKWLLACDIQPNQRAETLTINDWVKLTKSYNLK